MSPQETDRREGRRGEGEVKGDSAVLLASAVAPSGNTGVEPQFMAKQGIIHCISCTFIGS